MTHAFNFGAKIAAAPQAMNMNDNGAPQAGDMGDHLNEQLNLMHKIVGQGKAKYPYSASAPFNPVQAAGVRNNPAAPPLKAPAPVLGKAGSVLAFGAKLAASMCTPCDTPNSASNKKHMTGASPAVTEAGEKSEEIGKPPVTETEHSEAEAKQPEEGVKSAVNYGKMLFSLTQTPAQAGQKAMMAARRGANGLSRPPAGMLPTPDYAGKYNRTLGHLSDPHIGGSSRDDLAVWAQNHADAMVPKYTPRRDALSEVGQTAARRQGLTQAGVLGGAAGIGALSTAGQQAQPPEVKARVKPPMQDNSSTKAMSPATPTPITPTSLLQRATGIYPK
jgi:hypothetical protein